MAGSDYRYIMFERGVEVNILSIPDFPFAITKCGFVCQDRNFDNAGLLNDDLGDNQLVWTRAEGWDIFTKYIHEREGHGTLMMARKDHRTVLGISVYGFHGQDSQYFLDKLDKFKDWITKSLVKIVG